MNRYILRVLSNAGCSVLLLCLLLLCVACGSQGAPSSMSVPSQPGPSLLTATPIKDEMLSLAFIGSDGNVWLANVKDSTIVPLTRDGSQQEPYAFSARGNPWNPEGGLLLVERSDVIYQLDIHCSTITLIGQGRDAVWSPDGARFVFVKGSRRFWIGLEPDPVLVVQRTNEIQLELNTKGHIPCWTEDGSRLIYVTMLERGTYTPSMHSIWSWAVGATEPKVEFKFQLESHPIVDIRLAAQDTYLAIRSARMEYMPNLQVVDWDGKELWRSQGSVERNGNFGWSPIDSVLFAYISVYEADFVAFDASDPAVLLSPVGGWWVLWAPNGQYYATTSGTVDSFRVIVVDGEEPYQDILGSSDLFQGTVVDSEQMDWSADGSHLAFSFKGKVYVAAMGEQLQFREIADGHTPKWKP